MSKAPTPTETLQGYAPPSVTQFSVFLDNKVGKMHDLVEAFDGSQAKICAFSVHEASDHAVVRLITTDNRITRDLLRAEGLPFSEIDVLLVEVGVPHTLGTLCLHLLSAELNIRFAYPMMVRPQGTAAIALAVDDPTLAGQILRRKEYRLFGEADLTRTV